MNIRSSAFGVWASRTRLILPLFLIITLTILAYLPALHGGFIWDDDHYLTKNPVLTEAHALRRIWFSRDSPSQYFPLTYTSFKIERVLWGLRPFGYHLTNLLLHLANALLLWRLLARLSIPGAWLAAGIFSLHPVQVESVAWISERKNVLMAFFFLLSLLAWVGFLDQPVKQRWRWYTMALLFYCLALFSKATACTMPAALLLILWLQKKPIRRKQLIQIGPFVLLGLVMGLIVTWWERYHQGSSGPEFAIGFLERLLIASHAIWFYAGKLICPVRLTFSYPRWNIATNDPLAYGWLIALIGVFAVIYFVRRQVGRGPEVGLLFFIATLSPLLGFLMLYTFRYSFVADHYQYVASIGLIALFAATLWIITSKGGAILHWLRAILGTVLLVVLAGLTSLQAKIYRNSETLWNDTLAKNPSSGMAHNNLAIELCEQGRFNEGIPHFEQALAINPDHVETEDNFANALLQMGRLDEAVAHCRKALEIKPDYASAHNTLGNTFSQMGRWDEAAAHCRKALEIKPNYAMAHNNLANALLHQKELDQAISHYRVAIELQPNLVEAHNNLGIACEEKGLPKEAITHYQKAIALKPDYAEAHYNFAGVLLSMHKRDEAITQLITAVRIKPTYSKARRMLERLGVAQSEWDAR